MIAGFGPLGVNVILDGVDSVISNSKVFGHSAPALLIQFCVDFVTEFELARFLENDLLEGADSLACRRRIGRLAQHFVVLGGGSAGVVLGGQLHAFKFHSAFCLVFFSL